MANIAIIGNYRGRSVSPLFYGGHFLDRPLFSLFFYFLLPDISKKFLVIMMKGKKISRVKVGVV